MPDTHPPRSTMSGDRVTASAAQRALVAVKLLHTVVWALFAGSIVAIPLVLVRGRFDVALWLTGLVMLEVGVLVANRMRCPLTDVAARFTADRRDNFDIYLPEWLARHNKRIFGSLFAVDLVLLVGRWLGGG